MKSGTSKIGLLYSAIVITALIAFVVTYYQKNKPMSLVERTEQRAFIVGKQLIEANFEQRVFLPEQEAQERGLASNESPSMVKKNLKGEVSRDPWGQPFSFQVSGDGIKNSKLYIWSPGPNGVAEIQNIKDQIAMNAVGDDILVEIPF